MAAMSAACTLFAFASMAQDSQEPVELVSKIIPAEIWTCRYNDGQGPSDLDAAVDAWSGYMDDNDVDDYAAWTLTKHHYGPEQDFDFIWLGAWTDGNAMGAGTDLLYAEEGREYLGNFFRVADCNNHMNAGSLNYKLPEGGAPGASVIAFSNCNIREGATYTQIVDATKAWAAVLTAAGSQAAMYHWFPIYGGGGDRAPDFIRLTVYPNHTELGADYERMTNGELFRQSNALFADLVDCDVTRTYNAQNRRSAQLR